MSASNFHVTPKIKLEICERKLKRARKQIKALKQQIKTLKQEKDQVHLENGRLNDQTRNQARRIESLIEARNRVSAVCEHPGLSLADNIAYLKRERDEACAEARRWEAQANQ